MTIGKTKVGRLVALVVVAMLMPMSAAFGKTTQSATHKHATTNHVKTTKSSAHYAVKTPTTSKKSNAKSQAHASKTKKTTK